MIDTEALRKKVIDLAIQGKLTEQLPSDGDAEDLYAQILEHKLQLIKEGKIKKEKRLPPITVDEIPFEIPNNWKWVRLYEISDTNIGLTYHPENVVDEGIVVLRSNNIKNGVFDYSDLVHVNCKVRENQYIRQNDILICSRNGSKNLVGKCAIYDGELGDVSFGAFMAILRTSLFKYVYYYLTTDAFRRYFSSDDTKQINQVTQDILKKAIVPLPPLVEQDRIVAKLESVLSEIDVINNYQEKYINDLAVLKSKIIDAGIQGKLTEQLPEDGDAETLYAQIQKEKAKLVKNGTLKKEKPRPVISADEIPFEIPSNWKWVRFGSMTYIERGGSPRPIKSYITDSKDGINWIKIGDVEKGGKYIFSTKERIIPEGEKKSRHVYPGDFLLTNSMSFGRPYISKVEGCIHDGWLLIRDLNGFNADYLYYLLSSTYMYGQFCNKASGATVENLNIDKVNSALIPLPPLKEQERIAIKLESALEQLS